MDVPEAGQRGAHGLRRPRSDDNGVVNILDVSSFASPRPAVWTGWPPTVASAANYNARWDLSNPAEGAIKILDIAAINRLAPYLGVRPGDVGFVLSCQPATSGAKAQELDPHWVPLALLLKRS